MPPTPPATSKHPQTYAGVVLWGRFRALNVAFNEGGAPAVKAWGAKRRAPGGSGSGGAAGADAEAGSAAGFGSSELDPEERAARAQEEARARAGFEASSRAEG